MQHGVRRLKPGDTLYLRGGIYYESVYLTQSGTAQSPIVIAAYPGELPVLDGGLREFLKSPASSWEPVEDGAPDEYASAKTYDHAADRRTNFANTVDLRKSMNLLLTNPSTTKEVKEVIDATFKTLDSG
jgi:hypothetical protein